MSNASTAINQTLLNEISNDSWIRQSLFVPTRGPINNTTNIGANSQNLQYNSTFSYQKFAFADTSLGGNRSLNPKPQFCPFADLNLPSLLVNTVNDDNADENSSMGMGRYYGEAVDQNEQRIIMQFGVPAYNSLTNFFSGYYDVGHGNMVNSGEITSDLLYSIGKYAGYLTIWVIAPELSIASFLYGTAQKTLADIQRRPLSRFYYMKPTMATYWTMVTTIYNAIAVNMGLSQPAEPDSIKQTPSSGDPNQSGTTPPTMTYTTVPEADIGILNEILPKYVLNRNGGIDIRKVASRYQRLSDAHEQAMKSLAAAIDNDVDMANAIKNYLQTGIPLTSASTTLDMQDYIGNPNVVKAATNGYMSSAAATGEGLIKDTDTSAPPTGDKAPDTSAASSSDGIINSVETTLGSLWTGISTFFSKFSSFATTELRDGSAFVSFIVDYESHQSESFSNSTKSSDIAEQMNATAKSNRNRMYNLAGGDIGFGAVGGAIQAIVKGASDIATGLADSVGFSGIAQLGGKAFVDIPEFWDSSSVNALESSTYTIKLRTPYGNPIAILLHIMPTVAALLAAVSPRSAGRSSYSGPFLCKLYQKGRTQMQMGIITSLSMSRGTGNVGWNVHGQAVGIDITFTVSNLSKMTHMPITTDVSLSSIITDGYSSMIDEDTNFTDYMAVLGALSFHDQYYLKNRWRLRRARSRANFNSFLTTENFLTWFSNETTTGSIMSTFARAGNI